MFACPRLCSLRFCINGRILLVAACLPFKPCSTASPVVPAGSSSSKKRRVAPSNPGPRCPVKSAKVEVKKVSEKSVADASDDVVVSSSCEVDSSNVVNASANPKSLQSRNSLDYFVHTTQQLEVTTSSVDGDLVDLTADDESGTEAAVLSSTKVSDGDTTAAISEEDETKVQEPVSAECDTPVTGEALEADHVETGSASDVTKKEGCSSDDILEVGEVPQSQQEDALKLASAVTGSSCCAPDTDNVGSTSATTSGHHSGDTQGECLLDSVKVELVGRSTVDCVAESPLDKSDSAVDDENMNISQSPTCDNADKSDAKLNHATIVVLTRVDNENDGKDASFCERSEVSTTSVNVNNEPVAPRSSQKPKVRQVLVLDLNINVFTFIKYTIYSLY